MNRSRILLTVGLAGVLGTILIASPQASPPKIDYQRDIAPLFQTRCYSCHGPAQQTNGLRLDVKAAAMAGGVSGPSIKPGNSAESRLIQLVSGSGKIAMPPIGPRLSEKQVGLLRAWIDEGASWPEAELPAQASTSAKSAHWAFQPVRRPDPPSVRKRPWVRNPIDAFVLSRLESEAIDPSPEADRYTLIRRLSLDLIGTPPTPQEISDFIQDNRPSSYERLVDRLLTSSHYGEKWARHWQSNPDLGAGS